MGCPWWNCKCCSKGNADEDTTIEFDGTHYPDNTDAMRQDPTQMGISRTPNKGVNYHVMSTVWNPEHLRPETSANGFRSPDQHTTPDNALIQSFAANLIEKRKQKQMEEKRVYAVNIHPSNSSETERSSNPTDTMVSWTQQLQEQLKSRSIRQASASSKKELIEPEQFIDE